MESHPIKDNKYIGSEGPNSLCPTDIRATERIWMRE